MPRSECTPHLITWIHFTFSRSHIALLDFISERPRKKFCLSAATDVLSPHVRKMIDLGIARLTVYAEVSERPPRKSIAYELYLLSVAHLVLHRQLLLLRSFDDPTVLPKLLRAAVEGPYLPEVRYGGGCRSKMRLLVVAVVAFVRQ